jgi:hypothetical protein
LKVRLNVTGFGGAIHDAAGAGGSSQLAARGELQKRKKKPTEAPGSSLFADFAFDGLATVRDAYGRDITPVKPTAAVVQVDKGGPPLAEGHPPPVTVKARVRAAADAADAAGGAEQEAYTLRAEC